MPTFNDQALLRSLIDGSLTSYVDDKVENITAQYAIRNYSGLTTVDLENCVSIANNAFINCPNLETLRLPKATTIGERAFNGNNSLTDIYLPLVTSIGAAAFAYVGTSSDLSDTIIVLPNLETLSGRSTFDRGKFLAVDLGPGLSSLPADTFYHNTGQQIVGTLILRNPNSVVTAASTGAINGLRSVYVPSDLISSYQTATNWATYYGNGNITFTAIEGSQYENYYADGTPIPTT